MTEGTEPLKALKARETRYEYEDPRPDLLRADLPDVPAPRVVDLLEVAPTPAEGPQHLFLLVGGSPFRRRVHLSPSR